MNSTCDLSKWTCQAAFLRDSWLQCEHGLCWKSSEWKKCPFFIRIRIHDNHDNAFYLDECGWYLFVSEGLKVSSHKQCWEWWTPKTTKCLWQFIQPYWAYPNLSPVIFRFEVLTARRQQMWDVMSLCLRMQVSDDTVVIAKAGRERHLTTFNRNDRHLSLVWPCRAAYCSTCDICFCKTTRWRDINNALALQASGNAPLAVRTSGY